MDGFALFVAEVISAMFCFVLVRFMIKPYRYIGEGRYIGLPLGFGLLGLSYVFMGLATFFEQTSLFEDLKWLQLFTQAYAFAFLAMTYYYSKKEYELRRLWWEITFAGLILIAAISYMIIFVPPLLSLPSYRTVDEYFRIFNIVCVSYITVYTLSRFVVKPGSKTIWIPLAYLLLGFAQYSSLIWSLDSSFSAYLGAHILRLMGLLVFLYVAYQVFYKPQKEPLGEAVPHEENPA